MAEDFIRLQLTRGQARQLFLMAPIDEPVTLDGSINGQPVDVRVSASEDDDDDDDTAEPTPHIYLDLSTSVVTEREMHVIEAAPVRVIRHEYGAWVHVPPIEPGGGDDLSLDQPSGLEPEEEQELAHLEAEFERAGGRGVSLANRIDELRDRRELGEDWSEFRNLLMVLRTARDRGASWVNIDGDAGDVIPGLPTFDW